MKSWLSYHKFVFVVVTISLLPQHGSSQQKSPAPKSNAPGASPPGSSNPKPASMMALQGIHPDDCPLCAVTNQQQIPQNNGMNGQVQQTPLVPVQMQQTPLVPVQMQTVPLWKALTMSNPRLQPVQAPSLLAPAQSNLVPVQTMPIQQTQPQQMPQQQMPQQQMPQQQMPQQQMPQQQGAAGLLTNTQLQPQTQQQQMVQAYSVTYVPLMYRLFG
ncbi:hypothetical protein WDU94_013803 [Cyamophila willieti]